MAAALARFGVLVLADPGRAGTGRPPPAWATSKASCGPVHFADGFESGLTSHWSADAP